MEPRYNGVPRDWQNLFAIARFVSIYYAITGVNKIVLYAEDFVMGEGSSFINIQKVFKIISLALKCCLSDVIKVLLKGFFCEIIFTSISSPSTCFIAPTLANLPTMFANELFCPSSLWTITLTKALSTSPNTRTVKQRTRKKQCTNPDSETRRGNIVKIDEKDRQLNPFQAMFTSQGSRKGIRQRFSAHTIKTSYMVPCVTIQSPGEEQG